MFLALFIKKLSLFQVKSQFSENSFGSYCILISIWPYCKAPVGFYVQPEHLVAQASGFMIANKGYPFLDVLGLSLTLGIAVHKLA
jgi:hypothetical protein